MKLLSKVISMVTIKPSSPTPKPLRKHLLSSIDRRILPTYSPLVYFHASDSRIPNSDKSKLLKKSLSEVLSRFYPLAGTIVGNHYVDCNDAGIPFFEAEANCDQSHVLPMRNHEIMENFYPSDEVGDRRDLCLAVQITHFRCGGLALGFLLSHKVADAFSLLMLVRAWAAAASGVSHPPPKFDAATYFPPQQDTGIEANYDYEVRKEEVATRMITFPAATICLLRERYSGGGIRPSRVEALSAYIWRQFMWGRDARSEPSKAYVLGHAINIRRRVEPALSDNDFGNIVGVSRVMPAAEESGVEVARRIRDSVKGVKSWLVGSMDVGEKAYVGFLFTKRISGGADPFGSGLGSFP